MSYPEPPRTDWGEFAVLSDANDPEDYIDVWGEVQDDENWRRVKEQVIVPFSTFGDIPDPGPFDGAKAEALDSNVVFRWDEAASDWIALNTGTASNPRPGTTHVEAMSASSASVDSAPSADTDVIRKLEADSKADLTAPDGVLQSSQVPDLSITQTFTVTDQAARLSLDVQEGDVAIQTDNDTTYIFTGGDPSVDSNWSEIQLDVLEAIDGSDITPSSVTTPSVETDIINGTGRAYSVNDSLSDITTRTIDETSADTTRTVVDTSDEGVLLGGMIVGDDFTQYTLTIDGSANLITDRGTFQVDGGSRSRIALMPTVHFESSINIEFTTSSSSVDRVSAYIQLMT